MSTRVQKQCPVQAEGLILGCQCHIQCIQAQWSPDSLARSISMSWANLSGASLTDVCAAALWAFYSTFACFYRVIDATASSLVTAVFYVASLSLAESP